MKEIDYSLRKLHFNFEAILSIVKEMNLSKTVLSEKIAEFSTMYTELVKTNNTKIFLFCLDSLYFQYKSSMMDLHAMENNRKFIMNRMYCDYYKLYHLIISDLNEKGILILELKTYPKYKDLDILLEYNLDTIVNIHGEILDILYKLYEKLKTNKASIQEHMDTKTVLSISNFLNTLKYENGILKNQVILYINYLSFFHFSQKKMLIKLYSKMSEFNRDMEEYMGFNRIISIDDINSIYSESNSREENDYSDSDTSEVENKIESKSTQPEYKSENEEKPNITADIIEMKESNVQESGKVVENGKGENIGIQESGIQESVKVVENEKGENIGIQESGKVVENEKGENIGIQESGKGENQESEIEDDDKTGSTIIGEVVQEETEE
jgi:hypothetical protein